MSHHHEPQSFFDPKTAREHIQEDSQAWRGITGLLITIVSVGVVLIFTCAMYLL